jgi:hypothetical protein
MIIGDHELKPDRALELPKDYAVSGENVTFCS